MVDDAYELHTPIRYSTRLNGAIQESEADPFNKKNMHMARLITSPRP